MITGVHPAVDIGASQIELIGDLGFEARCVLVVLANGGVVAGVDRIHDTGSNAQATHDRRAVGDLSGREWVRIAAADVAERHATTVNQAQGVADLTITGEHFIEQNVGAGEQAEVFTDQHFTPVAADGAVELTHVDGSRGAVGFAVVNGDPERGACAKGQVAHILAHVEADVVGQKAHLDAGLIAIQIVVDVVGVGLDVEGIDVAVSGEGGAVFVVQGDGGGRRGAQQCEGDGGQQGAGNLVLVHGALRCNQ